MSAIDRIVIVGAGLAGARAAEALRAEGFDGAVDLIGDEGERPYVRPPLTKDYLRGETDRESVFVHPATFYEERRIELHRSTRVTAIDVGRRVVGLASGRELAFDRLLLATGARPRTLPVPGADLPGVVTLRTLADADALRAAATAAERVVVVGGGWIGAEASASLRQLGRRVTFVAPDPTPLARVLGAEIGAVFRDLHADHGVDLRLGRRVVRILGTDRVTGVEIDGGTSVACDLVLAGIGVEPRIELAAAAGIAVGDGIPVDEMLETSAPGIFAAGDVALARHPFYATGLRVEHWATARHQGTAAARSMLGRGAPYDRLPYFFSDQFDLSIEYSGFAPRSDAVVVRGDPRERRFLAFWLADGHVVAGLWANTKGVMKPIERLIRSRVAVAADALADPDVDLASLAPEPVPAPGDGPSA